ncbi:MAG: ABC transporter ATP-binding protein [Lachnospiraceae bacterium]|nr:ABC transporter ATP-binding protein [Lachnospiraceae bacterium]
MDIADSIRVSHVDKSFGGLSVLRDYSLTMENGKRYLLMAPSGTGKTTFLRILTGLDNADGGKVEGMPARTGMVFQEDRLCEEYDAVCNIMLGMGKGTVEYVRAEAAKILPEDCLTKPVKELSGGMRRRVALLRAVLSDSELLILDEPFAGLDEENRARSAEYLLDRLEGRTLLVTTHREDDVELLQGMKVTLVFSESLCYNA